MVSGQQRHPSLMDSIQAEVNPDASPLLQTIANHSKTIIAGIIGFICLIGIYFFYDSHTKEALMEEQLAFGKVAGIKDPTKRMQSLEEYLVTASDTNKVATLFAILQTALELDNQERAYSAWEELRSQAPDLYGPATSGMGQSLLKQNKLKEALALYEDALAKAPKQYFLYMQGQIVTTAEMLHDYPRAISACKAILNEPLDARSTDIWSQRLAMFQYKLATQAN